MKKNVLITISLLMALGIAGCGNNTSAVVIPDEPGTIADEPVAGDDYQDVA